MHNVDGGCLAPPLTGLGVTPTSSRENAVYPAFQITEYGVEVAGGGEHLCGGQVTLDP